MGSDELLEVLERARSLGLLGPGPVQEHVAHADAFARLVGEAPDLAVDLGSGGGVPGLVLAEVWQASRWIFVESQERRARFLEVASQELGLNDRVLVVNRRAEVAAHDPALRGAAGLVTARSFGPPAVTAECAVGFLRVGGRLLVAEPPGGAPQRWPTTGLDLLGLGPAEADAGPPAVAVMQLVRPCPDQFPRRVGVPTKRPLF